MKSKISFQEGSTLLVAAILTVIVVAMVGSSVLLTMQNGRDVQRTMGIEGAQAVGDAYIDWAFAQWRTICHAKTNSILASSSFSSITAPTLPLTYTGVSSSSSSTPPATSFPQMNYTISNYAVVAVNPDMTATASSTTPPTGEQWQSAGDVSYYYLASVDVSVPTMSKLSPNVTTQVRRVFEKRWKSPWQYAIYYNDMLELHPSPAFTVNGLVHSNGSIYSAPDGGNSLTYTQQVTYSDTYLDGYAPWDFLPRSKPQDETPNPNASPAFAGEPNTFAPGIPPSIVKADVPFDINSSQFNTTDSNPNNDSYRELVERPDSRYSDPFLNTDGTNPRYFDASGLRILVNSTTASITDYSYVSPVGVSGQSVPPGINVLDSTGLIISSANKNATPVNLATVAAVTASVAQDATISDQREGNTAAVILTTLDVSKLVPSNINGWNGVVYISDISAGNVVNGKIANPHAGIRVKNGAVLPTAPSGAAGLSIVTDNPLYVQGDFNTAATHPPAALIGDAINVLSNAWVDGNSSAALSGRVASNTTVNSAFLSGIVPTANIQDTPGADTDYSGGVENFPRFHEDWSNKTFTYNGSMVELFASQQATGRWINASYNPPTRKWAFDSLFQTTPPPGTLLTVTYSKDRWYLH